MASVVKRTNGRYAIQFLNHENRRKTVSLGDANKSEAEEICRHVEALLTAKASGLSLRQYTAVWLGEICDDLYEKLADVGLVENNRKAAVTLGAWLDRYFDAKSIDAKPATVKFYGHTKRNLLEHFGGDRTLESFDKADAEGFRAWLRVQDGCGWSEDERGRRVRDKMADNTVRRRIGLSRQVFGAAIDEGIIEKNPFRGLVANVRSNPKRKHYISGDDAARLLAVAGNPEWRALIALARFGSLRVPSEPAKLNWEVVDFEAKTVRILAPKTEHHVGRGERIIPMTSVIETPLRELYAKSETKRGKVFPWITENSNLATHLHRIIKRAGLSPWPKTWQNLRASGSTDFARTLPAHVAAKLCGHTIEVAQEHYWQATPEDLTAAITALNRISPPIDGVRAAVNFSGAAKALHKVRETRVNESTRVDTPNDTNTKKPRKTHVSRGLVGDTVSSSMGGEGLEPPTLSV